jgi:hypothetical protein
MAGARRNASGGKVYRVYIKSSQGSGWKLDGEFDTLKEAQARRRAYRGYAYETEVRTGRKPHAPSSQIGGGWRNPRQLLFKSKAAAVAYAKSHGAKKFSVRKLKRGG